MPLTTLHCIAVHCTVEALPLTFIFVVAKSWGNSYKYNVWLTKTIPLAMACCNPILRSMVWQTYTSAKIELVL